MKSPDDARAAILQHGCSELEQRHRDAMLDLVMAWASIDGALGMLLAKVLNVPAVEGAKRVERMSTDTKFNKIAKILRSASGGQQAAVKLRRYKKRYAKLSTPRNHIAHSHCAGCLTADPDYVIFQKFEPFGQDELAVYLVPLKEIQRAAHWGRAMWQLVIRAAD